MYSLTGIQNTDVVIAGNINNLLLTHVEGDDNSYRKKELLNQILENQPTEYEIIAVTIEAIFKCPYKEMIKLWIQERNNMAIHISGMYPTSLIETRRPGEDAVIQTYREENYEPTTKPVIWEAIDSLEPVFNKFNYTIRFSDTLTEYTNKPYFNGYCFMDYFQHIFTVSMLEDAQGYMVVLPEAGDLLDTNAKVEPYMEIVHTNQIVHVEKENGELIMFLYKCDSPYYKEDGLNNVKGEYVLLTENNYYRLYVENKNKVAIQEIFTHNFGFVPAKVMGGHWNPKLEYFTSYFSLFTPEANQYIRLESDHYASLVKCGHPTPVMKRVKCRAKGCLDGYIGDIRTANTRCQSCFGKGYIEPSTPYGVFVLEEVNPAIANDGELANADVPPLQYISPPTDILKYQSEELKEKGTRMKRAVKLYDTEQAQSGTAKEIDLEGKYCQSLRISNNIFAHVAFAALCMEYYMTPIKESQQMPIVIAPTIFGIKTVGDLLADLKSLQDSKSSISLIREVMLEITQKRYPGNNEMIEKQRFLMYYDELYAYDESTKESMLLASQSISKYQLQKSQFAPTALDRVLMKDKNAIDMKTDSQGEYLEITPMNYEKIKELVDKEVALMIPPEQTAQPITSEFKQYNSSVQ